MRTLTALASLVPFAVSSRMIRLSVRSSSAIFLREYPMSRLKRLDSCNGDRSDTVDYRSQGQLSPTVFIVLLSFVCSDSIVF